MRATAAVNATHLEPVPEDGTAVLVALAENSNQNLMDSKHAFSRPQGVLLSKPRTALANKSPNANAIKRQPAPESQKELVETMKNVNFQNRVLNTFRQKTDNLSKPTNGIADEGFTSVPSKIEEHASKSRCSDKARY